MTYRAVAEAVGATENAVNYWLNREACLRSSLRYQLRHGRIQSSPRLTRLQGSTGGRQTMPDMIAAPLTARFTLREDPDRLAELRDLAHSEHRTLSQEIRRLIDQRLDEARRDGP